MGEPVLGSSDGKPSSNLVWMLDCYVDEWDTIDREQWTLSLQGYLTMTL